MSLPKILTTTEQVEELAGVLRRERVIAVDLEADSMHNYREKVCLLQFSTENETVLIDPLAGADLASLKGVMGDRSIRKIFHAADYDIRCLARDFDIEIAGLFDTMISSQFLGEERFGLADMLKKHFDVDLDKQYQRADWSKRPLSDGMIRYAAGDTSYLHELCRILEGRLEEKGRLEWVEEEFRILEKVRFTVHSGPEFLRFKGAGTLGRRQLAVAEELLQWRDKEAQRRDCPLYKVLGNKVVLELARIMPKSVREIEKVAGISPRLADRYGRKLLAAVEVARALPEDRLPVYPRGERREKDPRVEKRLVRLKDWRKGTAAALELDPGVLINNATLEETAQKHPRDRAGLETVKSLKNWQRRELGDGLLGALG
jgi:ribonuclease D